LISKQRCRGDLGGRFGCADTAAGGCVNGNGKLSALCYATANIPASKSGFWWASYTTHNLDIRFLRRNIKFCINRVCIRLPGLGALRRLRSILLLTGTFGS
jgi:hypothetical protein